MDQNAFRSLLSAPRSEGESSKRGVLGGPAPKRGWGIKSKSGKEYEKKDEPEKPAFVPRSRKPDGKYKDRAEMRRKGEDDEYKPVEKLLEDLERRAKEEGEDVEKTRQYLGGDVEHSILVKGLDYSLLAARKAELAREQEEVADEELEGLLGKKEVKPEKEKKEEVMGKGFRSITQKAEPEKKKKKKKKKRMEEKPQPQEAQSTPPSKETPAENKTATAAEPAVPPKAGPVVSSKVETEPIDLGPEEDIFGDVGEYDLNVGKDDSSSDESDAGKGPQERTSDRAKSPHRSEDDYASGARARGRERSSGSDYSDRQRDRGRNPDYYRRRSRSRDRVDYYRRDRSRDREDYDYRDRYDSTSPRGPRRRRDDEYDYDRRPRYRSPSYSRSRSRSRERRHRDYSRDRRRYDSRSQSYDRRYRDRSPRRYRDDSPRRYGADSPSPRRRDERSPYSRSPSPPAKRARHSPPPPAPRAATRSPSPMFDPYATIPSRSPSPSSDEAGPTITGKLQPLSSSAIADVRGFLSADADAAKMEEKRAKKAAWRARQGLPQQEGAESSKREMNEKQKLNRDYVVLMNKMKKDEAGDDASKE